MRITLALIFVLVSAGWVNSQKVYKTRTGKKYHLENCQYVRNGAQAITLDVAQKVGLAACKVCKPEPHPAGIRLTTPTPSANPRPPAMMSQVAVQCKGKTQKGLRCKRQTKNANAYCYQHVPGG